MKLKKVDKMPERGVRVVAVEIKNGDAYGCNFCEDSGRGEEFPKDTIFLYTVEDKIDRGKVIDRLKGIGRHLTPNERLWNDLDDYIKELEADNV
jgi:hypothetical protein